MVDPKVKIGTGRLILRNLECSDVSQDYADWLNDPAINRYLSCAGMVYTQESCMQYVASYEGDTDRALIGIFLKENQRHIGNVTLSSIDWESQVVSIGISIGVKECMGRGLASEALKGTVKYCFEELGMKKVQAGVHASNAKSMRLFERCGFAHRELMDKPGVVGGKKEDAYFLFILHEDYQKEVVRA